jgi:hypothetical protein
LLPVHRVNRIAGPSFIPRRPTELAKLDRRGLAVTDEILQILINGLVAGAMTTQGGTPSRATLPDWRVLPAASDDHFASQIFTIRDTK